LCNMKKIPSHFFNDSTANIIMLKTINIVCVILFLAGCAGIAGTQNTLSSAFAPQLSEERKNNWKLMVGTWYGSQKTQDGETYSWIVQHKANGTYKHDAQIIDVNGNIKKQVEVGEWGIVKNIYFSVFKGWLEDGKFIPSDPTDPSIRDAYEVLELTDDKITYKNLINNDIYTVRKVSDNADFSKSGLEP
jgi:hypothetical protein